jgi:flotillin
MMKKYNNNKDKDNMDQLERNDGEPSHQQTSHKQDRLSFVRDADSYILGGVMSPPPMRDPARMRERRNRLLLVAGALVVGGIGFWISRRVVISSPSQFVVKTGLAISDLTISRTAVQWPFQKAALMSVAPRTVFVQVDSMSRGRIPFKLPIVLTIAPKFDDHASLTKFARLMLEKGDEGLEKTVAGIVQGESRMLTANLELDQLFQDREKFRDLVVNKVQEVINPLGVHIYNCNISELADLDDENRFFREQKQRALEAVTQQVRVNTAESISQGDVGEAEQRAASRKGTIMHTTHATLFENDRKREIAESKKTLDVATAQFDRDVNVARIEAEAMARKREWQLQREVEQERTAQQTERHRATEYSKVNVEAEMSIRRAEADAMSTRLRAEADLFAKQQEAAGILAQRNAEAEGLQRLVNAAGSMQSLESYLLINNNVITDVARQQADAVRGLRPQISVWSTGEPKSDLMSNVMKDVVTSAMPLFGGIKEQTGVDFLGRLGLRTMPRSQNQNQEDANDGGEDGSGSNDHQNKNGNKPFGPSKRN